ncbi:hypothetical protein [Mycobacteroides abscessus]|uniref:hypothetical protein n=1 Tax=Mycobacteroides abscessus TaxID=36809 RepID=UPI0009A8E685|nr:hypothetical protein [Mycobacteroides abscessus]
MDDLVARIDAVLDDDESLDDWAYPWTDSMRWAPDDAGTFGVDENQAEGELDEGWDWQPDPQIHVIPTSQVPEWTAWLGTLGQAERGEISWYVVCFRCGTAGERSVTCGCERAR